MDSRVIALVFISVVVGMMGVIGIGGIVTADTGCTESNPCEISTVSELQDMSIDGHYVLVGDIDASGPEFYPIGYDMESGEPDSFSGSLDGQGYEVTNLTVRSPQSTDYEGDVGLTARNTGDIKNLDLVDVDVEGEIRAGAITGWNRTSGVIDNVSVSGTVNGESRVGGIAGSNSGSWVNSDGYILNSSSSATVTATGSNGVGGLVGSHSSDAVIYNSYATGDVTNNESSSGSAGGLVGTSSGLIEQSYATGDVYHNAWDVGGLIGDADDSSVTVDTYATGDVTTGGDAVGGLIGSSSGTVKSSYATGLVTSEGDGNYTGGVVGWDTSSSTDVEYKDNYWNVDSTGQDESDVGTGLTTSDMTGEDAVDNMTGFDFAEVWMTSDSYPVLDSDESDDGTEDTDETFTGGSGGSDTGTNWFDNFWWMLLVILGGYLGYESLLAE